MKNFNLETFIVTILFITLLYLIFLLIPYLREYRMKNIEKTNKNVEHIEKIHNIAKDNVYSDNKPTDKDDIRKLFEPNISKENSIGARSFTKQVIHDKENNTNYIFIDMKDRILVLEEYPYELPPENAAMLEEIESSEAINDIDVSAVEVVQPTNVSNLNIDLLLENSNKYEEKNNIESENLDANDKVAFEQQFNNEIVIGEHNVEEEEEENYQDIQSQISREQNSEEIEENEEKTNTLF